MNDPTCPARDKPNHSCVTKFAEPWDRPGVGPRHGTRCAVGVAIELHAEEQVDRGRELLAMERDERMNALGSLLESMMDAPDDDDRCEVGMDDYR